MSGGRGGGAAAPRSRTGLSQQVALPAAQPVISSTNRAVARCHLHVLRMQALQWRRAGEQARCSGQAPLMRVCEIVCTSTRQAGGEGLHRMYI
jgi:hypothetical protein